AAVAAPADGRRRGGVLRAVGIPAVPALRGPAAGRAPPDEDRDLPAAAVAPGAPRVLVRTHLLRRRAGSVAGQREERLPLLLAPVPVRDPGRRVGWGPGAGGEVRDPAGVEPHRRVHLLPDAPGDRVPAGAAGGATVGHRADAHDAADRGR